MLQGYWLRAELHQVVWKLSMGCGRRLRFCARVFSSMHALDVALYAFLDSALKSSEPASALRAPWLLVVCRIPVDDFALLPIVRIT